MLGAGGLAEHVVGEEIAALLVGGGAADRLADGAADDELLAEEPHRLMHRLPDHRFADALDEAGEDRRDGLVLRSGEAQDPAGKHERPGRGVADERRAAADMPLPVAAHQLVADQAIGIVGIRDAQQRLGKAHERDALALGERETAQQRVEGKTALRLRPRLVDEASRQRGDFGVGDTEPVELGKQ